MPEFKYTALDRAGKSVTGTLAGRDVSEVAAKVRGMGYFPVDVGTSNGKGLARSVVEISGGKTRPVIEGAAFSGKATEAPTGQRVKRLQILLFTRELADLIDAGLPIDRALSVLLEQSDDGPLQAMIERIQGDVRAGRPLSDALRNFPRE